MTPPKPRALLSVSDKSGIAEFAAALVDRGYQIVSTGGTARTLREAGLPVTEVADITGHPEIMDGRVKTLHPAVHGPLLARRDVPADLEALADHGYRPIDIVAVNLYPFRETVASGDVSLAEAMEKVDIGGPTMIRAAAKNHRHVWVVVDPADYDRVLQALTGGEGTPYAPELRRELAAKVFRHIAAYDEAVAGYLAGTLPETAASSEPGSAEISPGQEALPPEIRGSLTRRSELRYGENPDQAAALYVPTAAPDRGIAALEQIQGKPLSYNNLLDLDGALLALAPFALSRRAAVAIVKHTTPCGIAVGGSVEEAFGRALACDPTSAFGSIIAVNRTVDLAAAEAMSRLFVECVVAPSFEAGALEALQAKKNLRVLTFGGAGRGAPMPPMPEGALEHFDRAADADARSAARFLAAHGRDPDARVAKGVYGATLVQTPPVPPFYGLEDPTWRIVTRRRPAPEELDDLVFAWACVFSVKSNAILLARDGATIGIGAGQMSRVDSSRLAVWKAGEAGHDVAGSVLASDAFFPFRDGVDAAAEAGVRAVVQPGGSVRDQEVIQAADEHGIAMVFTGRRLFRH
jgi:phosphoribosylaminoimidazolecarboxamide formyltransferase / IMP cyclohydrolase